MPLVFIKTVSSITSTTINYAVANNLSTEISHQIEEYHQSHQNIRFQNTSISKADFYISTTQRKISTLPHRSAIYHQPLIITPSTLNKLIPASKKSGLTIYSYDNNTPTVSSIINYLKLSFTNHHPISTTLLSVGDIMLSRQVDKISLAKNDPVYPFRPSATILKQADITIGNLEAPFYDKGKSVVGTGYITGRGYIFKANPKMVKSLKYAGIDILSLANNHISNQGLSGIKYTVNLLNKNHIKYSGAGNTSACARVPALITKNGFTYAFLSYTYKSNNLQTISQQKGVSMMLQKNLKTDIAKAKKSADIIVVSMHAGTEYSYHPNTSQNKFAHYAINSGADLVIGHHPHVVQGFEIYKNKPIFYSLGNFIFDDMPSSSLNSIAVRLTYQFNKVVEIEFLPAKIKDKFRPHFLSTKTKNGKKIINIIAHSTKSL